MTRNQWPSTLRRTITKPAQPTTRSVVDDQIRSIRDQTINTCLHQPRCLAEAGRRPWNDDEPDRLSKDRSIAFVAHADTQPAGALLLQRGTPGSPSARDVCRYLREFLSDPRVMDVPAPVRWLLLNAVILPFRPRKSAEAYQKIWTENGSPLLQHTEALTSEIQTRLGNDRYVVEFGMRYGSPSIADALDRLLGADVTDIRVLPLFPQYASSAGGSAAARLKQFRPDHILFSYHGLPERQIKKADPTGQHCLATADCCDSIGAVNRHCYRAQCFATTRSVAAALHLSPDSHSTTFQSRLAGIPWITSQTDRVLQSLHDSGFHRLAVFTNSFVSDCLETLEEIGIRLRNYWVTLGGEDLLQIPCVNEAPSWVDTVTTMISREERTCASTASMDMTIGVSTGCRHTQQRPFLNSLRRGQ